MDTSRIAALLDELKLPFKQEQVETDLARFDIRVDEAEGLDVTALQYSTEDGDFLRLLAYVDEVDKESPLDQLRLLLALNIELPVGAFCLDPEEDIVYATANVPLEDLDTEFLSWLIEFLFVAQEIYDQELNPDVGTNGEA